MKQPNFGFSPELDSILHQHLDEIVARSKPPWIAAFDADGTLWNTDVGEAFFQYQIDNSNLPGMPEDPWHHYESMKKMDHRAAYLWLAQINQGQPFEKVMQWARESVRKNHVPVFEPQKRLIEHMQKLGFEVYIVTASIEWAVRPAADLVGVREDHVIGIKTEIRNGIVGTQQDGALTWREGKAEGLLQRNGGIAPVFASGNTIGDRALIESSKHIRLAVHARANLGELNESEQELQAIAREKGWLTHQF
jgi:phosphoserine phosphatase